MIFLKTDEEVELLRASNDLLGRTYAEVAKAIQPGVTTAQLDKIAYEFIKDNGGIPDDTMQKWEKCKNEYSNV